MSFYEDLRNAREGKVRADYGDKIVRVESLFSGVALFIALASLGVSFVVAAVCGIAVMILLPVLIARVKVFAIIASVIFSAVWALLGLVIAMIISNGMVVIGIPVAVACFALSFFAHRVFAGIGFVPEDEPQVIEVLVANCTNCGAEVEPDASFCSKCGAKFTD